MKVVTTAPTIEPVNVLDLRDALDYTADFDPEIALAIMSARTQFELMSGLYLLDQTVRIDYDEFPGRNLKLDVYPLASVTSIDYTDSDGNPQTVASSVYEVDVERSLVRYLADSTGWPSTKDVLNAVQVTVQAGYGTNAADVPEDIRNAIRAYAAHLLEYKGDDPTSIKPPAIVNAVIGLHRRLWSV